ncbi:uncharacterized protein BJ171DRAFT_469113 [Polychytrium aggregatum]|uniref:uncharacterized protein n=1 Tax=Polychytrium aggregatum TaxID=110093 RepID=UPI0022FDF617|nr:uncharacterized protein BJ171DRAFT_469113 [Polychytrium aggregatum]KAI9190527.1 hypothetical protein BJ171DRAFT_469113 [Polychytrium aggregatum]
MARLAIDSHDPDIFTIICFNDSFQLALDHAAIKTLLRVCKRARPLLSSKLPRFHNWCQSMELLNPDGQLRIGLTPSDEIAISLHCEGQQTADRIWLDIQADQGNAAASYLLARILQSKVSRRQTDDSPDWDTIHQQITTLLQTAADNNHPMAQFHLAECYYQCLGVDQDHARAAELYRQAAIQGYPRAQVGLGRCFEGGEGVDQGFDSAIEWYSKAADQGSEDGRLHIHLMAVCLFNGFGVARDQSSAAGIFEQLAAEGHSDSQFWIGRCHYFGEGISSNESKAFKWFSQSADQDSSYAQTMVGTCYRWGYGVAVDHAKAFEWYRKSAEQNNRQGQCCLGDCYQTGRGVAADIDTAVFWYRKAAQQKDHQALNTLKHLGVWL